MDENVLSNETASTPVFEDTSKEAQVARKRKKPMPTGAKVAIIVVSIVLVLAILGALLAIAIVGFFGVIIALVVVLSMPENDGTFEYRVYDDTVSIWGLVDDDFAGALYIPEYIDGKAVTEIDSYAFEECDNITEVYIPNTVKSIDYCAFQNCSSLTNIEFGSSVETIEYYAFRGCAMLESVVIPDSVTSIGSSAFEYCYALKSVKMGSSVTVLEDYAFASCYALESVELSPSLEYICEFAFADCYALDQITIPYNVNFIGRGAFYLCQLTAIYFENETADWKACPYYDKDISKGEKLIYSYELSPENAVWLLTSKYVEYEWYCSDQAEE